MNRIWSVSEANAWYAQQPWLVGCNFFPSTAINPIEMWSGGTFDAKTIDRELGLAKSIGMNTVRTNFNYLVWENDANGLLDRFEIFLGLAAKHHISTMPCFFDDCAHIGSQPWYGPQGEPWFGVHNSRWVPSPPHAMVTDRKAWPYLEAFVRTVVRAHRTDARILCWDLYNEPGNSPMKDGSLPLVETCFAWARAENPDQPLTTGPWLAELKALNEFSLQASDVISFHNYGDLPAVQKEVESLRKHGRPLLITEWLNRKLNSLPETHLPFFKQEKIGCYNWGLVRGRTNTIWPWGSPKGAPEPDPWFHDPLRADGTPYKASEIAAFKSLTGRG